MKRPLVPVASLYAGGIVLGDWLHPPLAALLVFSLLTGAAALFCGRAARVYLLGGLLVLAGWTNLGRHTAVISPHDLRLLLGGRPADVKLRGTIHASPAARIFERGAKEFWHTTTLVRMAEIFRDDHWQPAFGNIIVATPGILASNYFNGQTVEIAAILSPLRGPLAPGLFDPRRFYQRQEIYYQGQTGSADDWRVTGETARLPLADRFSAWARRTLALGLPTEDEPLRLMWTLALDWKAPLTESVEEPFMRAGTYHIFAVDGLRIGLLAAIGIALLRAWQIPRAGCGLLVVPLLWFYAALTGWPASAVRAAIMMSIVIGGWAVHRPGDLINSLFAAALIILLWEPQQLFQAGFQLSFTIVLFIGLLVLPLRRSLHSRLFPPDPFLAGGVRPAWRLWLERGRRFGLDTVAMSLAAWLGSIPLAAYYFHLFTPVGVPANAIVVPLTALALMSCMGSLLTGGWFPGVAALFNHSAWFWMKCIITASQWAAHWAAGSWYVAAPRPAAFVWYYVVLLTVLTGWIFRTTHKRWVMAALVFVSAWWVTDWKLQQSTARIDILELRGAPAIFVPARGTNQALLLDCGDAVSAEAVVKPFLHAQGINHLANFGLTSAHEESAGGAEIVLTNFSVPGLCAGPGRARSAAYRRLEVLLTQQPGRWQTRQAGDFLDGWLVVYPEKADQFPQADDLAMVLQRTVNGHAVLLLSSLGQDGQNLLMQRRPDLRADIVIAGLPARDEPLSGPLLDLLQPKLIIIADSELPATRRAPRKLRERLARRDVRVIYCRDAGAITLGLRRRGWTVCDAGGRELPEGKPALTADE